MKKVIILIAAGLAIISGCLVYLLNNGVSLRINTLIKPSEFKTMDDIGQAVFMRLFPEFEEKSIVVVGMDKFSRETENILEALKLRATTLRMRERREAINFYGVDIEEASEISPKKFSQEKLGIAGKPFFTLTIFFFEDYDVMKIPSCELQQRLDLECLRQLSIKASQRKMKKGQRHFFLKQYNHQDYFLFVQK